MNIASVNIGALTPESLLSVLQPVYPEVGLPGDTVIPRLGFEELTYRPPLPVLHRDSQSPHPHPEWFPFVLMIAVSVGVRWYLN